MTATPLRPTRVRWFPILALVFIATLINYLDRAVFSIARPLFTKDLGIAPIVAGTIGSAFSWSYALAQVPGGAVLDRFGTRLVYFVSLVGWSLVTMFQGLVSTVGAFIGLRVALGLCEAPCFPANSRVLNSWFPQHERARANSIYAIGMSAGLAFFLVPLFWIADHYTWRGLFVVAGGIGVLFGVDLVRLLSGAARVQARQSGGARLHRGRRRVRQGQDRADADLLGEHSAGQQAAADPDHLARAVLRQHGADVLPDRLRELPGHAAPDAVDQAGHLRVVPLHGGGRRRRGRRRGGRSDHQARRLGHVRAKAAGGLGADAGLVADSGQLGAGRVRTTS